MGGYDFVNAAELVRSAEENKLSISEIMLRREIRQSGKTREAVWAKMEKNLAVMEASLAQGMKGAGSLTGLTGFDAVRLKDYIEEGKTLSGNRIMNAVCYAIAVNEVNASMGVICANPTAGSCGTVPGVLFSLKERLNLDKDAMLRFLFTAGAFGMIIANNASISGAAGGCQAEVGAASAMAAAASVEAAGGRPQQSAHAAAIALKNLLGLVCDPVAGLVEIPCIKRNAIGAANALTAADMALAGVESRIPCDEVIEAMYNIGKAMPVSLRETAQGGLAATPTGKAYEEKVFGKK